MSSKNYNYGLLAPIEGRETVLEQLRLTNQYRNKLVEIELKRRKDTDDTLRLLCPGLLECESELSKVSDEIKDTISQQKGRNAAEREHTDDTQCKARLAELKPIRKELSAKRKELRNGAFASEEVKERLKQVNDEAAAAVRLARSECGLYWGSYILVEQAADSFRKGAPPVFRGYRGEGRLAVQIQNGMTWDQASSGTDTRVRIVHTPQTVQRFSKRGVSIPMPSEKRLKQQYTVWVRIGSKGRDPVWAKFPMIFHRPIPDGVKIMWAIVQRRLVAGKERWQLTLSLRDDSNLAFVKHDNASDGVVGVDIGYRILPDGSQRVAYFQGSDGTGEQLTLPAWTVEAWKKVEDIQAIRDQLHNDMRADLKAWMATNVHPEWLDESTETMHAWRRISRLDSLVVTWRSSRFECDEPIMARLEAWRTRERHLWQYQENLRDQLLAWRKDYYRKFAAMLARRYKTIAVEDMDLNDAIHDTNRPEEDRDRTTYQRRIARFACLSSLIQCLKERASKFVKVECAGTSYTCNACGHANRINSGVMQTCSGCLRTFDRDENAAMNIRARGEVLLNKRDSLASVTQQGVTDGLVVVQKPSRSARFATARKTRKKVVVDNQLG